MCRSTDFQRYSERDSLKMKAFFIRFSGLNTLNPLPDSLTLLYPPRINEAEFEVYGSKIRPDSPAFLSLHRAVRGKIREGDAIYGSRERVRVGEGVRFEVYMGEEKVVKGIIRRGDEEAEEWRLECSSEMEGDGHVEVCVAVEGHVAMNERMKMVRKSRGRGRGRGFCCLEEIPEGREVERETEGGSCCTCGGSEGGEMEEEEKEEEEMNMELDGLSRWAVDVGIWVMCLGLGFLVSKASAKESLRRSRRIIF